VTKNGLYLLVLDVQHHRFEARDGRHEGGELTPHPGEVPGPELVVERPGDPGSGVRRPLRVLAGAY